METIKYMGRLFSVRTDWDDSHGAPWEECDGHGDVSEWTTRDKRPGEMVLCEDRGSRRYYDFAGAVRKAKAEGWDTSPYGQGTKGERAHRAALADFNYLRSWCNGDWQYIVVSVTMLDSDGKPTEYSDTLGGVETLNDYQEECALEMMRDILARYRSDISRKSAETKRRKYWASRDVVTTSNSAA